MISQTAEYALRALAHLVSQGEGKRVLSREIAAELGIPSNYLSKILHLLVRARILGSARGARGGFQFACDPASVSLLQVVNLFDGLATRRECFLGQTICSDLDPCHVHERWKPVITAYLQFLEHTSLAEMVRNESNPAAPGWQAVQMPGQQPGKRLES